MLLETAGWCESFYVCFLVPDLLFGPAVRFFLLHESVFSSCYNNEMELIYMLSLVFIKCSVLATSRICLLMGTLLRFAGLHRQPSSGLLRGLLHLEICKSRSASDIEL